MPNPLQAGNILAGVPVAEHKFQGVTTLDQLENYGLRRPTLIEAATQREAGKDKKLAQHKELRSAIQRSFDKARRLRAEVFSAYVEAVEMRGQIGGTPAVTLFIGEACKPVDAGLLIPYQTPLIVIDGETQTEARFLFRERELEAGAMPFALTVYHGIEADHAQQILHDYNRYSHPVTERQTASFNHTGQLSRAVAVALRTSGVAPGDVNLKGGVANRKTIVAGQQIMSALIGHAMGGQARARYAGTWFDELNKPTSQQVVNGGAEQVTAQLLVSAKGDPAIGKIAPQVWQIAGVLTAEGRAFESLDLLAGGEAWDRTRNRKPDGATYRQAERLAAVALAM